VAQARSSLFEIGAASEGHTTAEARFITLCSREPDAVPRQGLRLAAGQVRDWGAVVTTASRHGLVAYVRHAAKREGVVIPVQAAGALRSAALENMVRVMRLDADLARVARALEAVNAPAIVLKGPVLARTIYPELALRPYTDLDLTVQDRHEEVVVSTLRTCGFAERTFKAQDWWRAHGDHVHEGAAFHRQFVSGDGQAMVELHADPLQLGLKPTCEAARWQRALPVPHLPGLLMLCPEDQVVQLSAHAHKHGFDRLIWLKDLDLLLRAHGGTLDWSLVREIARQEGVQASVWYALRLAAALLGAPAPGQVLARLRPALPLRVLYGAVWPVAGIANLDGRMRRRAVQFDAAESWRGMLPGLVLMGRRGARARSLLRAILHR
jgi:Uncharacterised nucleotidyltransferase